MDGGGGLSAPWGLLIGARGGTLYLWTLYFLVFVPCGSWKWWLFDFGVAAIQWSGEGMA